MDRLIETKPITISERGLIRVDLMRFGLDGMTETSGERFALTLHAAMALCAGLRREIEALEAEQSARVVELKRA